MELAFGSTIAVARRGHLGDMLVCLPLLGILKRQRPDLRICVVASPYTVPLLAASEWVDEVLPDHLVIEDPGQLSRRGIRAFINPLSDESLARAAYQAGVPLRIGDVERPAAARWCNRFVWSRRKWSKLHEAQIVLRHLAPLGLETRLPLSELKLLTRLSRVPPLDAALRRRLCDASFNLVIHPKSLKSGREWPAQNFLRLIELLQDAPLRILLTGTECEREELLAECPALLCHPRVEMLMGATPPAQLIALLAHADGLVAGSTGPLHIAAALGIHTLGLFPRRASMDSRRWQPLGAKSEALQMPGSCVFPLNTCDRGNRSDCRCMAKITPEPVAARVRCWVQAKARTQGLGGEEATAA
jgi:ADP-heptose:LPS heptosyltransferase